LSLARGEGPEVISHKVILLAFPKPLERELVEKILSDFSNYDTSEETGAAGVHMDKYQCYKAPPTSLLPLYRSNTLCTG